MAAQKSTEIRRRLHQVQADQAALRRRQEEFERHALAAPSVTWAEAPRLQQRRDIRSCFSFAGPDAVLAYLSRYAHRIAIANSRLVTFDGERVTFKWKDYRAKGEARYKLYRGAEPAGSNRYFRGRAERIRYAINTSIARS